MLDNNVRWSGDDISSDHKIKTACDRNSWRAMIANSAPRTALHHDDHNNEIL